MLLKDDASEMDGKESGARPADPPIATPVRNDPKPVGSEPVVAADPQTRAFQNSSPALDTPQGIEESSVVPEPDETKEPEGDQTATSKVDASRKARLMIVAYLYRNPCSTISVQH